MPPINASKDELISLFRSLGAHAPEEWIQYLPEDPSTQLARYLFLKQAWDSVAREGDTKWMDEAISRSAMHPDEPYAGRGTVLQKLPAAGIAREDITELAAACRQARSFAWPTCLMGVPTKSGAWSTLSGRSFEPMKKEI